MHIDLRSASWCVTGIQFRMGMPDEAPIRAWKQEAAWRNLLCAVGHKISVIKKGAGVLCLDGDSAAIAQRYSSRSSKGELDMIDCSRWCSYRASKTSSLPGKFLITLQPKQICNHLQQCKVVGLISRSRHQTVLVKHSIDPCFEVTGKCCFQYFVRSMTSSNLQASAEDEVISMRAVRQLLGAAARDACLPVEGGIIKVAALKARIKLRLEGSDKAELAWLRTQQCSAVAVQLVGPSFFDTSEPLIYLPGLLSPDDSEQLEEPLTSFKPVNPNLNRERPALMS